MRNIAKAFGIAVVALFISGAGSAQSKVDLFAGYSYARIPVVTFVAPSFPCNPPLIPCPIPGPASFFSGNANGWEIAGAWKFSRWIGVVADFDGHYRSAGGGIFNPANRQDNFLFGPQVAAPMRISPFVHVLFGVAHAAVGGLSTNSFAYAIGGGVDYKVAPHIAVRFAQVDFYMTHYGAGSQNEVRISTGIVFRF